MMKDYAVGNNPMCHPRDVCEGNIHKTSVTLDNPNQYVKEVRSNIVEGIGFPGPAADFEDVRSLESFTILVNGVSIDSLLSKQQRKNYFALCCSQSSFLHDHLLKSLDGKLAAEIIIETTNIANAIRAGELFTPHGDYAMSEKTLDSFEMLGMNVGFLRAQLRQLLSLSFKSKQAKLEQACAKEEMRTALESKYLELKDRMVIVDSKIEALKEVAKTRELFFQEEADAPSP